jgi:hypothetical protein
MIHLLLLPGIFIHEVSHFIVGLLMNAKPVNFSIIPNKKNKSAGHVAFRNINFYNAFPVAIAPTLVGPSLVYFIWLNYLDQLINKFGTFGEFIFYYVCLTVIYCCLPSSQDVKVLFKNPMSIILYAFFTYAYFKISYQ